MHLFARIIQFLLILIPISILGWLGVKNFVPNGTFAISHSLEEASPFIDALAPNERVGVLKKDADENWFQTIVGDPVFFFVHPHRTFDTIDATIWFKNVDTPIVEFGALTSVNPPRYFLRTLQNLIIDQSPWSRINEGETLLLQRTPTYKTVAEFFAHPPSRDEIATYHTDLFIPFRLPNYVASKIAQTISVSLRGAHTSKVYVKQEPIYAEFSYMDMNRDNGSDPILISVTDETNRPILHVRVEDDGNVSSDKRATTLKTVLVETGVLPEGVYKIDVQASRDIFVRSIKTTQQKIVFLNGVYLGDVSGYRESFTPVTFWTEAKRLSAQTRHAESVQTMKIGSGVLHIPAPYQLVTESIKEQGLIPVTVSKEDVEILTDAPIVFSEAQYFRPDSIRLLPHTDLDSLHVNYILAKYTPPEVRDGWNVATVRLDAQQLYLDQGSWKFTFSTPEIEELQAHVDVKQIDLVMKRAPMLWYQNLFASFNRP
jgi:hypothetical protein